MRFEGYTLNVVQNGTGAGTPQWTENFRDLTVQFTGIAGGGSYTVEGSQDGSTWAPLGAAVTADGIVLYTQCVKHIRINRTVQGTGNPTILLGCRNARTDGG